MNKFSSIDLFNIDSLLDDAERLIRESVREWVSEEVLPIIEKCYQKAEFPLSLVPAMGELGLLGSNLPAEYGCAGINNVAYGLIMQELERGDSGLRSFASVQGALVMYPIYRWGTENQKRFWLPKLASGEKIGCFGLTEPDFGSNPGGMTTTAREEENFYILNGAKCGSPTAPSPTWQLSGQNWTVGSEVSWWKEGLMDFLLLKLKTNIR